MSDESQREQEPPEGAANLGEAPAITFESLGQGSREVLIEHHGQIYRLRETRNGKLILNK